jgi:hypothetical protein
MRKTARLLFASDSDIHSGQPSLDLLDRKRTVKLANSNFAIQNAKEKITYTVRVDFSSFNTVILYQRSIVTDIGSLSLSPITVSSAGAPTFSVSADFYWAPFYLEVDSSTSWATIRYTTDGTVPTGINGIPYSGPILIDASGTVRAVAHRSDLLDSDIAEVVFTIARWQYVGNRGFASIPIAYPSIDVRSDGSPVIAFRDGAHGDKCSAMQYSSGVWSYLGTSNFPSAGVSRNSQSVAMGGAAAQLYVRRRNVASSNYNETLAELPAAGFQ